MSIIASALVGVLALAAPAVAQQSPTQDAYGGVIAEVVTPSKPTTPKPPAQQQQVQAQQTAPAAAQPSSGALPFTGLQVTLVLLAGAALLGGGLVLRRATGSS
jgi:3-oxoacyl-ACP reductase-like protein